MQIFATPISFVRIQNRLKKLNYYLIENNSRVDEYVLLTLSFLFNHSPSLDKYFVRFNYGTPYLYKFNVSDEASLDRDGPAIRIQSDLPLSTPIHSSCRGANQDWKRASSIKYNLEI
jgi:hypothetical protein